MNQRRWILAVEDERLGEQISHVFRERHQRPERTFVRHRVSVAGTRTQRPPGTEQHGALTIHPSSSNHSDSSDSIQNTLHCAGADVRASYGARS